jgi:fumarate reductase flavoprotein subunit
MQETMEAGAGIYRTEASLASSAEKIRDLQERVANVAVSDSSLTFNTELTAAIELTYMLDGAEAIIHSALNRTESRGSHQRLDHPDRDDENFLRHSLAYREQGGPPRIEYHPVTITRWPPGERVYGQQKG